MPANNIIVIEIPHQMQPSCYWITKEKIVSLAFWDEKYADEVAEEQDEMEGKSFKEQFDWAFDTVTHDNYLSAWFESKKEAIDFVKKIEKKEPFKCVGLLKQLNDL